MFSGFDVTLLVLAILVLATLFAGVKTVPQGYNYTVAEQDATSRIAFNALIGWGFHDAEAAVSRTWRLAAFCV